MIQRLPLRIAYRVVAALAEECRGDDLAALTYVRRLIADRLYTMEEDHPRCDTR